MSELLEGLREILGDKGFLTDDDALERHSTDTSGWGAETPLAVARPASVEEVSAVMKLCSEAGQSVTPQGGLSGLAGGAVPIGGTLALSLERLRGVVELDADGATMSVLAGTTLEEAQDHAEEHGFLLALDLGGRGSCQVGGNVSTNAGGNRVIRYGMTRDQVLGLEVVLADGTIIDATNRLIKNNAGFDLKHLFIGTEGTLGIVTKIIFRLRPLPKSWNVAFTGLNDFDSVIRLLREAGPGLGANLSAFEVMWRDYHDTAMAVSPALRPPLQESYPLYVLIETRGIDEARDRDDLEQFLGNMIEREIVADAVVANSQTQVEQLWAIRDAAGEIVRHHGAFGNFDVSIPTAGMDAWVETCRTALLAKWPQATPVFFGHIGDGNIHLIFGGEGFDRADKEPAEDIVYGLVRDFDGSVAAEHGIGRMKHDYLGHSRTSAEIALMNTLKQALDPKGILNPGAVI